MISFNDRIYYVRLIDCPPIDKKFPTNSIDEWENYRGWGLRNASAFILVFDVNSESSFQYIRQLRDQIVSEFNDIPLLLVANKIDLLQQMANGFNSNNFIPSFYSTPSTSSSATIISTPGQSQITHFNNSNYRFNIRRDINMIIKKQWKRTILVECSAKYNWHVMNVFRELMRILENREQAHKPTAARAVQNALRNNQCSIM
uniref:Ras-like family n=2 Tax=Schistosoma mansoni TaxID=6183 RepID=A0A3Q0KPH8_SCHMA